jgi:hypothetical protein
MFFHPAKPRFDAPTFIAGTTYWNTFGQIGGSFALNLAITGSLNTGDIPAATQRVLRNSWIGGVQTAIPDVAGAMIIMESTNPTTSVIPNGIRSAEVSAFSLTVYPGVVREHMINDYYIHPGGPADCPGVVGNGKLDTTAIVSEGMTVGFADGHTKFEKIGSIISKTPTIAEYAPGTSMRCGIASSNTTLADNLNLNHQLPVLGLGQLMTKWIALALVALSVFGLVGCADEPSAQAGYDRQKDIEEGNKAIGAPDELR